MEFEVKTMLFRKKIEKMCAYCAHSAKMNDEKCLCVKKGVVPRDYHCRKFSYDPLKRVPLRQKTKDFSECDDMDFSL